MKTKNHSQIDTAVHVGSSDPSNGIKEEAHKEYVCTGHINNGVCYICECIEKTIDLTKKQALEEVEKIIDKKSWVIRDENRNIKINQSVKELKAQIKKSTKNQEELGFKEMKK